MADQDETVLAMSQSADFYPGLREGEDIDDYDGTHLEWKFSLPRSAGVIPGIFEIRFVRTLKEEEELGSPVLGTRPRRRADAR